MADNFTIPASRQVDPALSDGPTINANDPALSNPIIKQGDQQPTQVTDTFRKMTPEERAQKKALLIQAYDRGVVHDRLFVKLPPHIHGEWCRNDPMEIARLKTLGFTEDTEYATARALNSDGTNSAIVGDVIHMICPREVKEIIDEIRHDTFMKMNGKPGDAKAKTKEELEFESNSRRATGSDIPTMVESRTHLGINPADVAAALAQVDAQTSPQVPVSR